MHNEVVTTVSLANITIQSYRIFFRARRTFKIYFLSHFQTCNTELTILIMLYIEFPWLIYFITGSFYLLTPFIHFTHCLWQLPIYQSIPIYSLYLWTFFFKMIPRMREIIWYLRHPLESNVLALYIGLENKFLFHCLVIVRWDLVGTELSFV